MRGKQKTLNCYIVLIGLSGLLGAACDSAEQEQEVVAVVNQGVALLEDKDVFASMRLTSKNFLIQPGRLDRKAAAGRLMHLFRNQGGIAILHPTPNVEIYDAESARVSMPFVVAREGVSVSALSELMDDPDAWSAAAADFTQVRHVELSMIKEDGRWVVHTVRF